ncbi:hypothetical protein Tco_0169862 [Tanacetum coccineum]
MDTESKPLEDPIEIETLESPLTVAPPTSLPKSTSSTLVPILHRTARMVVRVPPEMSPGLFASTAEVAAMSESAFSKRFRSSHKSSSSLSSPDLRLRKRYRGTSKLVEDDEEDDDEKDEEIEENLDFDSMNEDVEDEGPTAEDEDLAAGDEDDEGHSLESDGLGLGEEEEAVPEGQQQAAPVVGIAISAPLGLGCVKSKVYEWYWKSKDVTQGNWVKMGFGVFGFVKFNLYNLCKSEFQYCIKSQGFLDGTDTESEPFKDPVKTETLESPYTVAPPTSLPKSTSSTLVPILRRTARMAVRVPPAMSPSLSASMAEVAAMSESAFRKRDDEEDDDEKDGDIEENLDSDSVSEDVEDEGPIAEDEDPDVRDEGLTAGDEGPSMGVKSYDSDDESRGLDDEGYSVKSYGIGLGEEEEVVPEGQQQAALVVGTALSAPLGLGSAPEFERLERVSASRQPTLTTWTDSKDGMVYIDVPANPPPAPPVQIPPSPEYTSGSLPISSSPSVVPSPISSPMIPLTVPSLIATPATAKSEKFLTELGAQVKMHGGLIHDHAVRLEDLSPTLFKRYDRDIGELFTRSGARPVLALESWGGQTDAQRAALWHAISDTQGENQELRLQLAEERRARLELAEIVDRCVGYMRKVIDREWSQRVLERVVVISWHYCQLFEILVVD